MKLDFYFSTPIYSTNIDLGISKLLDLCRNLHQHDKKGRSNSNIGGWQSQDYTINDFEEFELLNKYIGNHATNLKSDFGLCQSPQIANIWFNINSNKDHNSTHIHPRSFLSAVYYLQVNEGCGDIEFRRNNLEEFALESLANFQRRTHLNAITCRYKPLPGNLLIFPSYIQHTVFPNYSNSDRISISFNINALYV